MIRRLRSIVAYWRALLRALPSITPEDCLRRLQAMLPQYIAQTNSVGWAQRCLKQAESVIGLRSWQGIVSPGDAQAIAAYEKAVAAAFYALEWDHCASSLDPVPGSDWSKDQLLRIRHIGREHGRLIRLHRDRTDSKRRQGPHRPADGDGVARKSLRQHGMANAGMEYES